MLDNTPFVSVVVPVHNAGIYLKDCMDSLVYQTLENIEIIAIENGSTDQTLEILREYEKRFPQKVFVHTIPPVSTSAQGRTLGFRLARGKYIYSCDGDDLVDLRALETLYNKAISGDYDIVGGRNYTYAGNRRTCTAALPEDLTVDRYIISQNPSFWSKLVKKSLIDQMGDVPIDIPLSDVAFVLPMSSYATKVAYVNWPPVYHYFRRSGSEVNTAFLKNQLDVISAERIALANSNPVHRDALLYHLAIRIRNNLRLRWPLLDTVIPWLKELWPELQKNPFLQRNKKLYHALEPYAALPDTTVPCVVYVNGFQGNHDAKRKFESSAIQPFWNLEEIIELNEQNCDVQENAAVYTAYQKQDFEFVAGYFALKNIYENGGIYLHQGIQLDAPFNYIRYWESFFGFIDDHHYSDWVFGGKKGSKVIRSLLETYTDAAIEQDSLAPLSKRIRDVLTILYDMPADGRTNLARSDVCCTFGPEVMFCQTQSENAVFPSLHLCRHQNYVFPAGETTVTISDRVLQTVIRNCSGLNYADTRAQQELAKIKSSNSWRVVRKIRKLGQGRFGPFLKGCFRFLVKIYTKLKK